MGQEGVSGPAGDAPLHFPWEDAPRAGMASYALLAGGEQHREGEVPRRVRRTVPVGRTPASAAPASVQKFPQGNRVESLKRRASGSDSFAQASANRAYRLWRPGRGGVGLRAPRGLLWQHIACRPSIGSGWSHFAPVSAPLPVAFDLSLTVVAMWR